MASNRLSCRIYFATCQACGRDFSSPNKDKHFCNHRCYGDYRSIHYRGEKHGNWKGIVPQKGGYLRRWVPGHPMAHKDGYALEHRYVAYEAGMNIRPGDHVHHRNHNKTDNRIENLIVLHGADHARYHAEEAGHVVNQFGTWPLKRLRNA